MKLTKTLALVTTATAMSLAMSSANATFLSGGIQELEDENAEVVLTPDSSSPTGYRLVSVGELQNGYTIQVGDLFAGVVKVNQTSIVSPISGPDIDLGGSNETFTSIFLIEATSVTCFDGVGSADCSLLLDGPFNPILMQPTASTDLLTFGAAGSDAWAAVYGDGGVIDISATFDVEDLDGMGGTVEEGTAALFFDGVPFEDAVDAPTGGGVLTLEDSVASYVDGGELQYELGFTGADGEFWNTVGADAAIAATVFTNRPANRISLNVTEYWEGVPLIPHNYLGNNGDLFFTDEVDFQGFGSFQTTDDGSPWLLGTDTNFYIQPVPAPGSLALLSLGLLGLGFRARATKK